MRMEIYGDRAQLRVSDAARDAFTTAKGYPANLSIREHARPRCVAQLTGSATLPAFRRRGVQAALIAARLGHACERGADLAAVTTAPGSQSQANVMKHGFLLGYARVIL